MELTNKNLAFLLLIAIVISIGGTIVSLNKLDRLSSISGFASSSGTGVALLNVSSSTSIVFDIATVDFGNGSVNTTGSFNNCTMTINGTAAITRAGCIGFNANNPSGDSFIIENNGNTYLNVTLNSTYNASGFIGGNLSIVAFQYAISDNVSGSCLNNLQLTGWSDVQNGVDRNICYNLSWSKPANALRVGVKVVVPDNAPTRSNTNTFTVTGIA